MKDLPRIAGDTRVTISPRVYARAFNSEVVLLDFARGDYFGLDEIGAEVWRHLESGATLAAIADALVERYEADKHQILDDIVRLVTTMIQRELVTVAE